MQELNQPKVENHRQPLLIRYLGLVDYETTWRKMQAFASNRNKSTVDELWVLEHPAVFTMGQAASVEHLIDTGDIAVVNTDRGGQVTYHGPGQLVIYPLIDIQRLEINVRDFVSAIETSIITMLEDDFQIHSYAKKKAPGVYIKTTDGIEKKIASLGLRIKRGSSYHGLSLNVAMDLSPFEKINPCGHVGLAMTQLKTVLLDRPDSYQTQCNVAAVAEKLIAKIIEHLAYSKVQRIPNR